MKKILSLVLTSMLVISLSACSPKDMPSEKLATTEVLSTMEDSEGGILLDCGDKTTYPISLPVEGCDVEVTSSNESIKASLSEEGDKELLIESTKVGSGEITINFTAKGYNPASITIPVKVELRELDFDFQLKDENVENISFDNDVLKMPVGTSAQLTIDGLDGTDYTCNTEDENIEVGIEEDVITISPKAPEETDITISAFKDENYEEKEKELKVVGVPTIKLNASAKNLSLFKDETATVTITSDANPTLRASVTSGDAKVEAIDGGIRVTGGSKASTIGINAQAEGWLDGYVQINVGVKQKPVAPKEATPVAKNEEKAVESPKTTQQPKNDEPQQTTKSKEQTLKVEVDTSDYDDDIASIIYYTNKEREKAGVPKLEHVYVVDTPAMLRAEEAGEKWSHTRPDGSMYYTMFGEVGLSYGTNGENLFMANAYLSPKKVVEEWMDSPGHKENILRKEFTGIGVGCYEVNGEVYWCQLFIG